MWVCHSVRRSRVPTSINIILLSLSVHKTKARMRIEWHLVDFGSVMKCPFLGLCNSCYHYCWHGSPLVQQYLPRCYLLSIQLWPTPALGHNAPPPSIPCHTCGPLSLPSLKHLISVERYRYQPPWNSIVIDCNFTCSVACTNNKSSDDQGIWALCQNWGSWRSNSKCV